VTVQLLTRGTRFGAIRLTGYVGSGSFADVYEGFTEKNRRVAVKVLRSSSTMAADESLQRFRREMEIVSAVSSRHVAAFVEADLTAEHPWIATEFVDGPPLGDQLKASGPLPPATACELAAVLASALADVHALGVVHRDLSTSNVLLGPAGPVVVDFGISTVIDGERLTRTGQAFGTPGFAAPEVERGESAGPEADVYGLGRVVLTSLGVEQPGDAPIAPELQALLGRMIDPEPSRRPQPSEIASSFGSADLALATRRVALEGLIGPSAHVSRLPRRFRGRSLVAATVVGALIAASVVAYVARDVTEKLGFGEILASFNADLGDPPEASEQPTNGIYVTSVQLPPGKSLVADTLDSSIQGEATLESLTQADTLGTTRLRVYPMLDYEVVGARGALGQRSDQADGEMEQVWLDQAKREIRRLAAEFSRPFPCEFRFSEVAEVTVSGGRGVGFAGVSRQCRGQPAAVVNVWLPAERQRIALTVESATPIDLAKLVSTMGVQKADVVTKIATEDIRLLDLPLPPDGPDDEPFQATYAFEVAPGRGFSTSVVGDGNVTIQRWIEFLGNDVAGRVGHFPRGNATTYPGGPDYLEFKNWSDEPAVMLMSVWSVRAPDLTLEPMNDPLGAFVDLNDVTASLVLNGGWENVTFDDSPVSSVASDDTYLMAGFSPPSDVAPEADEEDPRQTYEFGGVTFTLPSSWAATDTGGRFLGSRLPVPPPYSFEADDEYLMLVTPTEAAISSNAIFSIWLGEASGLANCDPRQLDTQTQSSGQVELEWTILTTCDVIQGSTPNLYTYRPQSAPIAMFSLSVDGGEVLRGRYTIANATTLQEWGQLLESFSTASSEAEP
jgi:tRNA A-37 threonylcarbamoyl transferase component Bud32